MTWRLDGNLLVALRLDTHVHHERAHRWFARLGSDRFATCAIARGTLLRVHMRFSVDGSARAAWKALAELIHHPQHEFWEAGFSYELVPHHALTGAGQATDAWLCELARRKEGASPRWTNNWAKARADAASLVPQ